MMPLCLCGCGRETGFYKKSGHKRDGSPIPYCHSHKPSHREALRNSGPAARLKPHFDNDGTPRFSVTSTNCWEWSAELSHNGYGRFTSRKKHQQAHRAVWEWTRGQKIPSGLQLDHLCRNRKCVNPDHMECVSGAENIRRGENAKLNHEMVRAIRAEYVPYVVTLKMLSAKYGVSRQACGDVILGRRWRGV